MIGRNANDLGRQILAALTPPAERYEIGPADPDRGYGLPVTAFDRQAALDTAARLSAGGGEIHVVRIVTGSQPRVIAAFIDRRPVPPALITRPGTGRDSGPHTADPGRLPARAAPAPAGPVPRTTRPLRAAIAAGGPLRPHRLVHADGTPLTCWPAGRFGPAMAGAAAGVIPAPGQDAGWLQVVRRDDGGLQVMHPALIAPAGANPYALLPFRDQQRFGVFDAAEAAGGDWALLPARLAGQGDRVRVQVPGGSGLTEIREITAVHATGPLVQVTTAGDGGLRTSTVHGRDQFQVLLPARHPAEDGRYAARLFAPLPAPPDPAPAARGPLAGIEDRVDHIGQHLAALQADATQRRADGRRPGGRPA